MLAVAAKVSSPPPTSPAGTYPVPGGLRDTAPTITQRALLWSLVLHLFLALGALIAMWKSNDGIVATLHSFDATIVPLSALDTHVPHGAPQPKAPENPPQIEPATPQSPRVVTKESKVISAAKAPSQPAAPVTSESSDTKENRTRPNVAPIGDDDASVSGPARISYQDMVATRLAEAKRYPERALRKNVIGDGAIRITISSTGDVSQFEIIQSTESAILDEELKDMVERAAPFPPFPSDLRRDTLAVIVPVSFRLER